MESRSDRSTLLADMGINNLKALVEFFDDGELAMDKLVGRKPSSSFKDIVIPSIVNEVLAQEEMVIIDPDFMSLDDKYTKDPIFAESCRRFLEMKQTLITCEALAFGMHQDRMYTADCEHIENLVNEEFDTLKVDFEEMFDLIPDDEGEKFEMFDPKRKWEAIFDKFMFMIELVYNYFGSEFGSWEGYEDVKKEAITSSSSAEAAAEAKAEKAKAEAEAKEEAKASSSREVIVIDSDDDEEAEKAAVSEKSSRFVKALDNLKPPRFPKRQMADGTVNLHSDEEDDDATEPPSTPPVTSSRGCLHRSGTAASDTEDEDEEEEQSSSKRTKN